jgi:transketolase
VTSRPQTPEEFALLERISREMRYSLIEISERAQSAHLAGSLSCIDLLVALYWTILNVDPKQPQDPQRDRLVFSKGHAICALYVILARRGFFPEADLIKYNVEGSYLPEQPSPGCAPGVEWATGSLGHGLGVGLGMALAAKIQGRTSRSFVIMSDGECQEGSVWEAAMLAPRLELGNLVTLVDFNKWQATGRSCEIMQMEPFRAKWEAFGWECREVNGHSLTELVNALHEPWSANKPLAIVAHTVKGKGASFMEDDNNWHYRAPTLEEVALARAELGLA